MEIIIKDIEHINEAAQQFVEAMGDNTIFAFYGHMGAGKTTFIKAICDCLGVEDVVTSPTFAIVNEYHIDPARSSATGISAELVYHFDFYRIKREEEVYDIGYEEYISSGEICLMEWPELIEDMLPYDTVRVCIEEQPDGSRLVTTK